MSGPFFAMGTHMTKQFNRSEVEKMLKTIQDGLDHYDSDYKDICLRCVQGMLEDHWVDDDEPIKMKGDETLDCWVRETYGEEFDWNTKVI